MTDEEVHKLSDRDPDLSCSRLIALGLTTVWCIYLSAVLVQPFVSVLAWSLALTVASQPLSSRLHQGIRNRSLASFISLTAAALIIFAPALWVAKVLIRATTENIAGLVGPAGLTVWLDPTTAPPRLAPVLVWLDRSLHLQQMVNDLIASMPQRAPQLVTTSALGIVQLLLVLFTSFFFIRDGTLFLSSFTRILPLPRHLTESMVTRVLDTVHACIFGVFLMAILQGALGSAIFWWLGLPQPALWGVVMGLLAIVPYLGAFVVWVPTAFVLAMHGEWHEALLLTIWGAFVIGLADNFLYPVLVGKRLRYHTLLIFIFMLGGVFVCGGAGIIIGPIVLSVTHSLIALWGDDELRRR